MTQQNYDHFRMMLMDMEHDILSNIESESVEEENPFEVDGDLVDRAEAFNSASVIEGLSSSQKKMIDEIRRALQRIKDSTFGHCSVCGLDIESDRLEAIPYADKCKKHMNANSR